MLVHTFCHVPGIGVETERRLWTAGFHSWQDLMEAGGDRPPTQPRNFDRVRRFLADSVRARAEGDLRFFAELLPPREWWRLFGDFRHTVAYLDIETTGLNPPFDHITTIAVYDGKDIATFVHGRNLGEFEDYIERYRLIVTYNGKSFDIPYLRQGLGVRLDQVHIDLRFLLAGLGYRGGLKGCEAQLGLDRGDLEGVDGYTAVLLWHDYRRHRNGKALETLLAYNVRDVTGLDRLMVTAYNLKLKETPFAADGSLADGEVPPAPYAVDGETLRRVLRSSPAARCPTWVTGRCR